MNRLTPKQNDFNDRLLSARILLTAMCVVCCLSAAAIVALATVGATVDRAQLVSFVDAFNQNALTLNPSGRLNRSIEIRPDGVALRFAPDLPYEAPDPASLLLTLPPSHH